MTSTPTALVCREVFDENSQPSAEEINEYAQQIGIDPANESHLLSLARDGLMQALPAPWKAYYDDKLKTHYFYNVDTKVTQWDHPLDQVYKNLVIKAKLSSERGDSILDDTCVSIQDLVTYEEDARNINADKSDSKEKMEGQDSSIETSLEEELGSDKKGKIPPPDPFASRNDLSKSSLSNPFGKKPLPPVGSLSDRRLLEVKGLLKNPGHSNTFPRSAQTSAPKFKSVMFQDNANSFDNSDSDQSYEQKQSIENKWTVPSFGNINHTTKHTPEIIDLSFNPRGLNEVPLKEDSLNSNKPKKGLSLSGGGSVFLKSNRNPLSDNSALAQTADNPKGILRERSFIETTFKIPPPQEGNKVDNHFISEEDRKIVRFNLENKEETYQRDYSPSPSSNSSSDVLHGKQGSVINISKANSERTDLQNIPNRTLIRRNSDIPVLNTETPSFINGRKLKPLKSDDNIKVEGITLVSGTNKNPEHVAPAEDSKVFKEGSSNSPTRKLIKPLPGDFIKPSLFQKPFQKLSDIIKPGSPDTDSESDYTGIKGLKPQIQKNKLSINLMESVDSEASVESPDKESKSFEEKLKSPKSHSNNDALDKLTKEKLINKRMDSIELRRNSLNRSSLMVKEQNSGDLARNVINMDEEMALRREKEIREMKMKLDLELKDIRIKLEEKHKSELSALKVQLDNEHIKNKAELQKLLQETRENHKKIIEETKESLIVDFENRKMSEIEIEKEKLSISLLKDVEEIKKYHKVDIERLKQENKSNLQKILTNLEHENMKAINELSMQYADDLEIEKVRLNMENKTILDKMRNEHEAMCNELKKDYRSEVDLLRSQQAAHLSALRDRLRRERERPSSVISPPPQSTPLSPRDEVAFEKLRCDKRLLEDKYRCLKEKYARLKNDVKISIERRNKRREQSQTTGSETDKSHSHKNGAGLDKSTEGQYPRKRIPRNNNNSVNGGTDGPIVHSKPPIPDINNPNSIHVTHHKDVNLSLSDSTPQHNSSLNSRLLNVANKNDRGLSPDHSRVKSPSFRDKSPLGKVVFRNDKNWTNCDNDNSIGANDISLSQSDSHTVSTSRHGKKVHGLEHHNREKHRDNVEQKNKGVPRKTFKPSSSEYVETTVTDYQDSSDTGMSDHMQIRESLIGRNRKKLFTRLKSASTSRLNYTVTSKIIDHTCNPIENLRQQLRKLEELEEQFPDVTLNADTTAYRLRYPFPESGGGGELGFLRHRALVEREGVRRAKAALKKRSDSLKQRRRTPQPWQDECELTDMEVSLHRTRSIIGEKVIRLRHIDKTLRRMQAEREGREEPVTENTSPKQKDENKETTLSDISSHSSGFSSTDMAHSVDGIKEMDRERDNSADILSSLQTLNTEIQDIWQVLNAQQQMNIAKVFPLGQILYTDMGWQLPFVSGNVNNYQNIPPGMPAMNVPAIGGTAQDQNLMQLRINNFRQFVQPMRPQQPNLPIVQQAIPSGVATSLVERTRDLRDWLKQQATL